MPGDLPPDVARAALHRAADRIADYLETVGEYPVVPGVAPGDVAAALPEEPPLEAEPMERILDDYERIVEPAVTHWNHPGFLAYFGITGSAPGIVGEALAAALNVNAMLWRTSPAATELEERVCGWLARMLGLPAGLHGHIVDTASTASLVALAAARHRACPDSRAGGLAGGPRLALYASDEAHSSIEKAAIVLGVGTEGVRRVPTDEVFRMDVEALAAAVARDREAGWLPFAVVATAGTTSTTSVDPLPEIAALCREEGIWLHVDAAYAGSAAVCPELRDTLAGLGGGDSLVVNPHKWLFTPIDCSVLWVRRVEELVAAFSLVPDYLATDEEGVTNLMDLGFQLGRRFRALKLWMVIRAFGVEGLRERIRGHIRLAAELARRLGEHPRFELAAPAPFSTVCFRALAPEGPGGAAAPEAEEDAFNERLLARVNAAGPLLLSPTRLRGRFVLRAAVGNLKTGEREIDLLWRLLLDGLDGLDGLGGVEGLEEAAGSPEA